MFRALSKFELQILKIVKNILFIFSALFGLVLILYLFKNENDSNTSSIITLFITAPLVLAYNALSIKNELNNFKTVRIFHVYKYVLKFSRGLFGSFLAYIVLQPLKPIGTITMFSAFILLTIVGDAMINKLANKYLINAKK